MTELGPRMKRALGTARQPDWNEARSALVLESIRARVRPPSRGVGPGLAGAAVLAAAAAVWLWVVPGSWSRSEIAVVPSPALSVMSRVLTLADGSRVEPGGPASAVRVIESTSTSVRLRLDSGDARFEVVPDRQRRFRVEARDVVVEAIGTVFSVAHSADSRVRVRVDSGRVRVTQGKDEVELSAIGEEMFPRFPPVEREDEATPPASASASASAAPPGWQELARAGDVHRAYAALTRPGAAAVRDVPNELMLAADVSRQSGHPAAAARYLQRLVDDHPRDPRASVASFTLGRVYSGMGQPARAAAAFARAHELGPSGALAEDALAREVESWAEAGNTTLAQSAARRYLARYPNSPRAKKLMALAHIE